MEGLAEGQYVRYRSSEDMISKIDSLSQQYPQMKHIYLEIETVGTDVLKGVDLFEKLAVYNNARRNKAAHTIDTLLFIFQIYHWLEIIHRNFLSRDWI